MPDRIRPISAVSISRLLAKHGHERSRKVPGGRAGILSPVYPGFKVWQNYGWVAVTYLPTDARGRHARLTAIRQTLVAAGYRVETHTPDEDGTLRVSFAERGDDA
jgi:hypothetical protein